MKLQTSSTFFSKMSLLLICFIPLIPFAIKLVYLLGFPGAGRGFDNCLAGVVLDAAFIIAVLALLRESPRSWALLAITVAGIARLTLVNPFWHPAG
jgi:hypothetical protein